VQSILHQYTLQRLQVLEIRQPAHIASYQQTFRQRIAVIKY